MKVIATRRTWAVPPPEGITPVSLEEVLTQSDVVSLHCPLTDATKHLINAESLKKMKPTAYLINTARGPLIDDQALADALNEGRLAGAGLDVLSIEPPPPGNPLFTAKNCLITPHIAWASGAARTRLLKNRGREPAAIPCGHAGECGLSGAAFAAKRVEGGREAVILCPCQPSPKSAPSP